MAGTRDGSGLERSRGIEDLFVREKEKPRIRGEMSRVKKAEGN